MCVCVCVELKGRAACVMIHENEACMKEMAEERRFAYNSEVVGKNKRMSFFSRGL